MTDSSNEEWDRGLVELDRGLVFAQERIARQFDDYTAHLQERFGTAVAPAGDVGQPDPAQAFQSALPTQEFADTGVQSAPPVPRKAPPPHPPGTAARVPSTAPAISDSWSDPWR